MAAKILTDKFTHDLKPSAKPYEYSDKECRGLVLRVQPSGAKLWYLVTYTPSASGKRTRYRYPIGSFPTLHLLKHLPRTLSERREDIRSVANQLRAKSLEVDLRKERRTAIAETKREKVMILKDFIETHYRAYSEQEHKTDTGEVLRDLKTPFKDLMKKRIDRLTHLDFHRWQAKQVKKAKPLATSTIHRRLGAMSGCLTLAISHGLIDKHPLQATERKRSTTAFKIKRPSQTRVRYLTKDEETRLRAALMARDGLEHERKRNELRGVFKHTNVLSMDDLYADHVHPMVLLAMNTGIRNGALLGLEWQDVNFHSRTITVRQELNKSGKTQHLPLNAEAMAMLKKWQRQSISKPRPGRNSATVAGSLLFPHPATGKRMKDIKTAWHRLMKDAKITDFRFHDLRHHFASKLIMKGHSLYEVQELLGHSSPIMTQRYAHLAPSHLQSAVESLCS